MTTRRQAIATGLAALSLSSFGARGEADGERRMAIKEPASDQPLRRQARESGLIFGAATEYDLLVSDPALAGAFARECELLVLENDAKWERLRPSPDRFDFTKMDGMFTFAERHDMQVRCHPLVWHYQLPDWFDEVVTKENARELLVTHIETVAGRYAGRVHSWDVVNEAVSPDQGRADGLDNTPWLKHLGPGYIDLAFRTARAADPDAVLVYNDYAVEYDDEWHRSRRAVILDLLTGLLDHGTPIDAFGIHAHLYGHRAPEFEPLLDFMDDLQALGLEIMITELDVADQELPADIDRRDQLIAKAYEDFLGMVLPHPAVTTLVTWGLADHYTWLNESRPRSDGLPSRPLPLDDQFQRKPAWDAISRALKA